jgi:hypothetical protein
MEWNDTVLCISAAERYQELSAQEPMICFRGTIISA